MANVLLTSPKLSTFNQDDINLYYGKAAVLAVTHGVKGIGEPPHAPQYIVDVPYSTPLLRLCLSDPAGVRIKLSDFSESSIITASTQSKAINMPHIYRAPELVLRNPSVPSFSAEIWALGVLFHSVSTGGKPIFHDGGYDRSDDKLLKNIVLQLGKLPEPIWSMWDQRFKYFDQEGRALDKPTENTCRLRYENKVMIEEERILFERVLQTMLVLEPEKRVTIDKVVNSEFFVSHDIIHE